MRDNLLINYLIFEVNGETPIADGFCSHKFTLLLPRELLGEEFIIRANWYGKLMQCSIHRDVSQEDLVARLTREKAEQLRTLSSQLLLFESRLCRKQKEIEASLSQRESIILRQQRVIRQLQSRLAERSTSTRDSPPCDALDRLDSLGDSDSAVVLEETADDPAPPR